MQSAWTLLEVLLWQQVMWTILVGVQIWLATFTSGISASAIADQPPVKVLCDIGQSAEFVMPVTSSEPVFIHHEGGADVIIVLDRSQVKVESDYKNRIKIYKIEDGVLKFALANVSKKDAGTYQGYKSARIIGPIPNCSQNLSCIELRQTHVTASPPPTQGGSTMLTCHTTASAALPEDWDQALAYSWFKDGVLLPQETKREVSLGPLTPEMRGNYTCCPSVILGTCPPEVETVVFPLQFHDQTANLGLAIGLPFALVVALVLGVAVFCLWKRRRGKKESEDIEMQNQEKRMIKGK